jgi:hypothetical protein
MTMTTAPVQGNLLVAVVMTNNAGSSSFNSIGSGWTQIDNVTDGYNSSAVCSIITAYKIAGASESTTQTPATTTVTVSYAVQIWEIAGASGAAPIAAHAATTGVSQSAAPGSVTSPGQGALGLCAFVVSTQSGATPIQSAGGGAGPTSWTAEVSEYISAGNYLFNAFQYPNIPSGAQNPTQTYGSLYAFYWAAAQVIIQPSPLAFQRWPQLMPIMAM